MIDHRHRLPHISQGKTLERVSVDEDLSPRNLSDSEESIDDGGFSCSSSAHNPDLLSRANQASDSFDDIRQVFSVAHPHCPELNFSF